MLYEEAYLEYKIITSTFASELMITANFIERVSYGSLNPIFRSEMFRKRLKLFRQWGLRSGEPEVISTTNVLRGIRYIQNG